MYADKIPDIIIADYQSILSVAAHVREGDQNPSSQELGEHVGISAAQIRKDISQFRNSVNKGLAIPFPSC
jgi:NADH/NAD ratio-sensing transcriptional regulator Rex